MNVNDIIQKIDIINQYCSKVINNAGDIKYTYSSHKRYNQSSKLSNEIAKATSKNHISNNINEQIITASDIISILTQATVILTKIRYTYCYYYIGNYNNGRAVTYRLDSSSSGYGEYEYTKSIDLDSAFTIEKTEILDINKFKTLLNNINTIFKDWQKLSENKQKLTYYQCHSNCHSSCYSRSRR